MPQTALAAALPEQRPAPATPWLAVDLLAAADADADALGDRLHDGALQALVVARYAADAAVRGGDPAVARDAVQEALVALRTAVWDLRPRGADGLEAALAELAQRRTSPTDLSAVDAHACAQLSPAARATAFRFVQAALPDGPAAVTVAPAGDGRCAVVTAGGTPQDLTGWTARALALGGLLVTDEPCARLLLPLETDTPKDER